jgi:hypothetical protein
MSAETRVYSVLKPLAPAKSVFRDIAPEDCNTVPRITFQFIGGSAINFVDSATIPSKRNYRVQINVWHNQRDACNALARQVENAMRADLNLQATVLGTFQTVYEQDTRLYGTLQDFSIWSD